MNTRQQYQHRSLPQDGHIRILILYPGRPGDPLVGKLEAVSVDNAGCYEALSYVWLEPGPPDTAYEILIRDGDNHGDGDGHRDVNEAPLVLSGGAIFAALHRLRLDDRPRRIWADQCCINQNDLEERGQQVRFMNQIYQDASHVLVWLGLDAKNEAASAFRVVYELDEALRSHPPIGGGLSRSPSIVDLESHIRKNHKAVQALTDRAWFKRGWVVQEIGTATPATMIWGDAEISWDTLAGVCERLKKYHRLRSELGIMTSDISFLYRRFVEPDEKTHHANRFNFVYELQRSRHLRFSDQRDRVFAFLGHYSVRSLHQLSCGGGTAVDIAADYTKTVEQTYVDVAVRLLRANSGAACVLVAAVQHRRLRDDGPRLLPSWVPDWRHGEAIMLAEPICPHTAHGESSAKLEIVEVEEGRTKGNDHRPASHVILRIHGVEIDTVAKCSRPLRSEDFYGKKTALAPDQPATTMIERLWREVCGISGPFDLDDAYPAAQEGETQTSTAFFAFMQTLSNGCVQAAGHACTSYAEVPNRVWLQKAARYIVETLGSTTPSSSSSFNNDVISDALIQVAAESAEGGAERESDHDHGSGKWSRWATSAADGRVFARTAAEGYYLLGPSVLEPGDVVCVLFGAKVPFCLRPLGGSDRRYLLVGECYVHGLMKGEAMGMLARGEVQERVFEIV